MKKLIFYIPAIIAVFFYGFVGAISYLGTISPFVVVWLVLFFSSGFILSKNVFLGSLLGILPAIHLIYMGTQETGQIFNEMPTGIVLLVFYILCGVYVYRNNRWLS